MFDTRLHRQDLAQHTGQLRGHGAGGRESVSGIRVGGTEQQPVEELVPGQHGMVGRVGDSVEVAAVLHRHVHGEHGQRAADGVDVGGDGRPGLGDLRRLETSGAVEVSVRFDGGDGAEIDDLDLIFGHHDVVGFEVVVGEADRMQMVQRGQHLEHIGDGLGDRHPLGSWITVEDVAQ